jgi:Cu-processing system permease protein
MNRILKYVIFDILNNKIVVVYAILLALFSWSTFSLEDNASKGLLSLLNIILLTVPLVSILFSTIYIYNGSEFISMLLSQPIKRSKIWWSMFGGLSISLTLAFILGAGIPIFIYSNMKLALMMVSVGILVTIVFVAIACLASIMSRDKAKGIGVSILLWLYFALLFDGLVLFLLFQFSEYPIEKIMVVVSAFSPIDLSRILILLHLDVSAMMGYTGAIFKNFFGTSIGLVISFVLMVLWIAVPFFLSLHKFKHKDM